MFPSSDEWSSYLNVAPILGHPRLGVNCTAPLKRDEKKKEEKERKGSAREGSKGEEKHKALVSLMSDRKVHILRINKGTFIQSNAC